MLIIYLECAIIRHAINLDANAERRLLFPTTRKLDLFSTSCTYFVYNTHTLYCYLLLSLLIINYGT